MHLYDVKHSEIFWREGKVENLKAVGQERGH